MRDLAMEKQGNDYAGDVSICMERESEIEREIDAQSQMRAERIPTQLRQFRLEPKTSSRTLNYVRNMFFSTRYLHSPNLFVGVCLFGCSAAAVHLDVGWECVPHTRNTDKQTVIQFKPTPNC